MKMMKKVAAGLVMGLAVVTMAGCGSDMSGTYVPEKMGDAAYTTQALEVHKGDKDGYTINVRRLGYMDVKHDYNPASVSYNRMWEAVKEKDHILYDLTFTWEDEIYNQLFTTAVKDNRMTYKDSRNGGFVTGTIAVDKNGNLIDEAGRFSNKQGTKYVKVKELNIDELKKKFQENATRWAHETVEYNSHTMFSDSEVKDITFKDGKSK